MTNKTQHNGNTMYFLSGLLIGGLVGTATMLLMAPQSGKETRDQIQATGIELRDGATDAVEKSVGHVRQKGQQISADFRQKADALQKRGQNLIDEQREQISARVAGNNGVDISS